MPRPSDRSLERITALLTIFSFPHASYRTDEIARLFAIDRDRFEEDVAIAIATEIDENVLLDAVLNEETHELRIVRGLSSALPLPTGRTEMLALALALKMTGADSNPTPEGTGLFGYLCQLLDGSAFDGDFFARRIHMPSYDHDPLVFAEVVRAYATDTPLRFTYENTRGGSARRTADIATLSLEEEGWYAHGYDHDCAEQRTFKIARMREPERLVLERAKGADNRTVAATAHDAVRAASEDAAQSARLRFTHRWSFASREWPLAEVLTPDAASNEPFEVRIPYVNDGSWVIRGVISLGGQVELIEPASLREELLRTVEALGAELSDSAARR